MDNTEKIIDIVTPFNMRWLKGYKKLFPGCRIYKASTEFLDDGDIKIFMWCNQDAVDYINLIGKASKIVVFVRRYEMFTDFIEKMNWSHVDAVIMVNDYLAKEFEKRTGVKPHVIYNGIITQDWVYKERKHGSKIAMVGFINQKKNLSLALQILKELPENYELHLAGEIQCQATMEYIDNIAKSFKRKIYFYGQIDNIDLWLEDKNYILCTAISEGSPNNVTEAMIKGIKPVVHNWPGAKEQFKDYVFDTVEDAADMISEDSPYVSIEYRLMVERKFGWGNYQKIKNIVDNL